MFVEKSLLDCLGDERVDGIRYDDHESAAAV